jgi:carbonic anhydrase
VQDAWDRGQELAVHGWIYSLRNGWLKDLNVCITSKEQLEDIYRVETDLSGDQ